MSQLVLGFETAVARDMAFKHRQGYVTYENTNMVRIHLPFFERVSLISIVTKATIITLVDLPLR